MSGAVFFWSCMATTCGFAGSYWQLFAGRCGLGLGEAVLPSTAFSLLRDGVPPQNRSELRAAVAAITGPSVIGD